MISKAWDDRHHFTLTDSQLLTPFQQGKLWREYNMDPKTIAFMDVCQIRTRAMVNLPMGTVVSILPGQPLESTQIIADPIEKAFDLWVRLRAYLYTLAYVSILDSDWFPYQAAVAVSEQLLVLYHRHAFRGQPGYGFPRLDRKSTV